MKRTKILVLLSILLIVVLVVLKLRMNKQEADNRVYTYEKDKSVLVETDTIQKVYSTIRRISREYPTFSSIMAIRS